MRMDYCHNRPQTTAITVLEPPRKERIELSVYENVITHHMTVRLPLCGRVLPRFTVALKPPLLRHCRADLTRGQPP